ncbi:fasciclin domain-containing protein [Actinacidiphila paucisporea]|uniref:Uncaracterized surface protein containing fasciclin (FAS1) repeats n=1 Tax=Actinacidiphila paucisporea TaxID=310782 RepID=A0A1M7H2B7_9ACTN|nr:fasciclin domain-containing protein [Actinacidiphila paucisporea]SHM22804.1 Uncaracterized surface protein containing fasciclin (FAS1) repeats [Actinacidiphila paucisporea]
MTQTRIPRRVAVALTAAAVAVPLSLGGIATAASATSGPGAASPSPTTSDGTFGTGCSGSAAVMARADVATAAATNPQLATLAAGLKKAGLFDTLNSAKDATVFAPTNAAFKNLSASKLASLLANSSQLKKVLGYHVVSGKRITPAELPNGSFKTLEGGNLTTSGSGTTFKVNNTANIVCGNIKTRNATVYLIDSVLTPPSS